MGDPVCGLQVNGTICVCQNCHPEELPAPGALKEPLTPERALREAATCVWDPARPPSPSPSTPGLSHATGAQRRGEHLCHRSASSLPPSTVPGLQQQHHTTLGVLHHVQRCLRELQVEDLGVLGAELGTTANEEVWGRPKTRDLPTATASPTGQIQRMRCSATECSKGCSAWWEQSHSRAQGPVVFFLTQGPQVDPITTIWGWGHWAYLWRAEGGRGPAGGKGSAMGRP